MTDTKPNAALICRVLNRIDQHPERFDMDSAGYRADRSEDASGTTVIAVVLNSDPEVKA